MQNHKKHKNSGERYDDFIIEQFKNDKGFLKLCLKNSFVDYTKTGDNSYFLHSLEKAVKAHGISKISRETGLSRQGIYALCQNNGNPSFKAMEQVLKALGLKISLKSE